MAEIAANLESAEVKAAWDDCRQPIVELGIEEDSANACVAKAFGWNNRKYWKADRVEDEPVLEQVCHKVQDHKS